MTIHKVVPEGWREALKAMYDAAHPAYVADEYFRDKLIQAREKARAALQAAPEQESWSDADINDVTMRVLGGWPSFEAQSWACKVVHAVLREATPPTSATVEAATIELVRETLQGIVSADWRKWEELADPEEFVRWAKSRANHALHALASQPAQQAEGSLYTALAKAKAELDADYRRSTTPQAEAQAGETAETYKPLTDDECDEFRRLPGSFNDMMRAVHEDGWTRYCGVANEFFGNHYKQKFERALTAQPQAVKWKVVDVRQALPVTDRQDVYPATRYVYKRLYERDEVCGYAYVELPAFNNDVLVRALRNKTQEENDG